MVPGELARDRSGRQFLVVRLDLKLDLRFGTNLQGIDSGEIIETVHGRRAPMVPVSVSLRL